MEFPYGKAAFSILILAAITGIVLGSIGLTEKAQEKPDIIFETFTKEHLEVYKDLLPKFEREHNCHVQLQQVDPRALQNRLESAMEAGAPVPDMVELQDGTMGYFTKGPLDDVGFVDITDKVHSTMLQGRPLWDQLVTNRFSKWSSRGRIFALIHDVHPAFLCYRRDLCEQLGIDVNKLTTWDEFAKVGMAITKDYDGDGIIDHYMIDLQPDGGDMLRIILIQHGGALLDKDGECVFDSQQGLDAVLYYVRATQDPPSWAKTHKGLHKFSFPAGWGQPLAKAMTEGLDLFYMCPDWRTKQFYDDVKGVDGKMMLMPLPAWEPGGLRTSTWGGTGLAFTKASKHFDLAWELAMYLYYTPQDLGPRFQLMNILPPLRTAWAEPQIHESRPFFSGQKIGELFAQYADQVPQETITAYINDARDKFGEAYIDTTLYYQDHGEDGLVEYARADLNRCANQVRTVIHRNVFLKPPTTQPGDKQKETK